MCGRYYRQSDKQRIAEAFHLGNVDDFPLEAAPSYNIAPTTMQPVIRNSRDNDERQIVAMRWGMVPFFAKSFDDFKGISTINAKAETLQTNRMWRRPFQRHRCIVPADGYYEWAKLGPKTKQPYAFALRDGAMIGMAAVWDAWKNPVTNEWLQSYSIITTDPNELTATVHNRMPVILKLSDYDRWLDREHTHAPPVDLLRPFDADKMTAHTVDPRVGNVRNDEPSLCTAWQCPPNSA